MKIRQLSNHERAALEDGLKLAAKLLGEERPLKTRQVQELYDAFIQDRPSFSAGVTAIGLAFGQLIVEQTGYDWVRVEDEYGEETCVSPSKAKLICAPISIIQKRMDRREIIDLGKLKDEIIVLLQSKLASGDYEGR